MNLKIKFELEETELNGEIENLIPSSGGSLPSGGTTGQILTKNSDEDGDAGWKDNNFVVTESGISEALGYVPRKAWYVNVTITRLNDISSDKTPAEIYQAYTDGYSVYAAIQGNFFGLPFVLPLLSAFSTNGNYTILFGVSADPNSGTVQFTLAWNEKWYMRYNELIDDQSLQIALSDKLDKNQGTSNSGKFLGIGADGVVVPTEVDGGGENSDWKKIRDISVTSEAGVVEVSITEDSEGNSLSLNEAFILIKSETKQYAYAPITIRNGNSYVFVGEYRLANETENAPGVIRIRPFGLYWMASYMTGGYQQNVVDYNWGFYYTKSQPRLSVIPKITGIRIGFSTIEAEVWGR